MKVKLTNQPKNNDFNHQSRKLIKFPLFDLNKDNNNFVWLINEEVGNEVLADYFSPVNPRSLNKQNLQPRGCTR